MRLVGIYFDSEDDKEFGCTCSRAPFLRLRTVLSSCSCSSLFIKDGLRQPVGHRDIY